MLTVSSATAVVQCSGLLSLWRSLSTRASADSFCVDRCWLALVGYTSPSLSVGHLWILLWLHADVYIWLACGVTDFTTPWIWILHQCPVPDYNLLICEKRLTLWTLRKPVTVFRIAHATESLDTLWQ